MVNSMDDTNKPSIYFLHVPKTGGGTVLSVLRKHYSDREYYRPLDREGPFRLTAAQLSEFRLFTGHQLYGFEQLLPKPVTTITIFREPRQRILSLYNHIWRSPRHHLHKRFVEKSVSLEQFLADKNLSGYTHSIYANVLGTPLDFRFLSRRRHNQNIEPCIATMELRSLTNSLPIDLKVEIAKYRIEELTLIGITEHMEESINAITTALNLPPATCIPKTNKTPDNEGIMMETMTLAELAALEEFTEYDEPVYRLACEKFLRITERPKDSESTDTCKPSN